MALDKLDKIGADGVAKELIARGIDSGAASLALSFFSRRGRGAGLTLDAPQRRALGDHGAIRDLESKSSRSPDRRQRQAASESIPASRAGLSYYTGAIMEIAVPDLAGSLGGGGRYDNLIGMFLGRDVPACGFSLGLERIIVVMTERNMFPESVAQGPADVMVSFWKDGTSADALALASELRRGGLRVDVYPEEDKLGKQLKYARLAADPVRRDYRRR